MKFELIKTKLSGEIVDTVNAREVHSKLESKQDFSTWVKKRIKQGGFDENIDYIVFHQKVENLSGGRPAKDYHVSMDMAEHLGMMEPNKNGKEVRQHFIDLKKEARKLLSQPVIPQYTTTQRLSDIDKSINMLERLGMLDDRDRLQYADSIRNAGMLMLPQAVDIHPVTISTRVTELGLKANAVELQKIGTVAAKLYRNEYGEEPIKHNQYVAGALRSVNSYTTEHLEIIDDAINIVLTTEGDKA